MTLIEELYLFIILFKEGEIFQRETFIRFIGIYHYNKVTLKMSLPQNKTLNIVDKEKWNDGHRQRLDFE